MFHIKKISVLIELLSKKNDIGRLANGDVIGAVADKDSWLVHRVGWIWGSTRNRSERRPFT